MGQEFIIKSQSLEDKVNQLLPSQGGFQAGVDLSASTTIIPIVDLTESAEGSNLRQDLQTAISHNTATTFDVVNTNTTILTTTGYFRILGTICSVLSGTSASASFIINDGATSKIVYGYNSSSVAGADSAINYSFDFVILLQAGHQFRIASSSANTFVQGSARQIADLANNLIDP